MKLKFLNYRSLYIEQLFAEMSFSTFRESSYSPTETIEYLSGQRDVFTKNDEGISFFTAIHSWGTVEVYFKNSSLLTGEFESIVGNIGCIEAEYVYNTENEKGTFELTFLLDTQIYEQDLCQRAFSDEG